MKRGIVVTEIISEIISRGLERRICNKYVKGTKWDSYWTEKEKIFNIDNEIDLIETERL